MPSDTLPSTLAPFSFQNLKLYKQETTFSNLPPSTERTCSNDASTTARAKLTMSLSQFRNAAARLQFRALRQRTQLRAHSTSTNANKTAESATTKTPTASATASPSLPPIWQRLGPLTTAANAYSRSQRKRPYTTQIAGALVIYLFADLSAQRIGGREHDPKRTARMLLIGLAAAVPYFHW